MKSLSPRSTEPVQTVAAKDAPEANLRHESLRSRLQELLPAASLWIVGPNGCVVDLAEEKPAAGEASCSHGMYVKRWIAFRLERFCPSSGEKNVAERMRSRAEDLLRSSTILCGEDKDKKSPYYGDAAYKQAALEEGWVRVRAPSRIEGGEVIVEVFSERDSQDVIDVVRAVARSKGHGIALSEGGPISRS